MVESYFFRRAKPDNFSEHEGIGVYLGPSETVLQCDKYVDTDNAIREVESQSRTRLGKPVRVRKETPNHVGGPT